MLCIEPEAPAVSAALTDVRSSGWPASASAARMDLAGGQAACPLVGGHLSLSREPAAFQPEGSSGSNVPLFMRQSRQQRPEYSAGCHVTFLLELDGNSVELVNHNRRPSG